MVWPQTNYTDKTNPFPKMLIDKEAKSCQLCQNPVSKQEFTSWAESQERMFVVLELFQFQKPVYRHLLLAKFSTDNRLDIITTSLRRL